MGWMNNSPEEGSQTPDTQSDRSVSPHENNINLNINTSSNSNAQLINKLSTMEAAHLNQLHEVTSQMAERELHYKESATQAREEVAQKEIQLQQSQSRVDSVERRIRERDVQLSTLKEEKAGCMRQIADLKNQLYQLQFEVEETTCDKADITQQWQAKLVEVQRELSDTKRALDDALKTQVDAVTKATSAEQENNKLKKQLQHTQGNNETEVSSLQKQLSELRGANTALTTQISDITKNKTLKDEEISNLRSMLRARDDAISSLQGENQKRSQEEGGKVKERVDQINNLTKENDEMKKLVEKQNQALKEMTAKWDKQKEEYQEQCKLVEARGEEISALKLALHEGVIEKEEVLQRSNSDSHSRVTALEMELQKMNEKVDELTSVLNESMEEIEDLQADVVFKEGRIASLEKEIEEASSLLEARADEDNSTTTSPPSSPSRRESGNFARLRQEIEKVTRERAQLESDHSLQLSLLKTSKDCDIAKVEKERDEARAKLSASTEKVSTLEKSLNELEHELEKTREVMDQLDAEEDRELEEMKEKVNELQEANDKLQLDIEQLRSQLKDKERELEEQEVSVRSELREAQQALIAMDKERSREQLDVSDDGSHAKIKELDEELAASRGQVHTIEAKLSETVRQKDMVISDLKSELSSKERYAEELKDELETLHLSVERGPSKRNYGMSIDPEWHEPETISKLKVQVSTLVKEKRMIEHELRSKIDMRDSTIATLVLSSSKQEANIADMKSELSRLQKVVDSKASSDHDVSQQLKDLEAERRKEVNSLKDRTHELTIELKQTNRRLVSVTEELECAKSQLEAAETMPDVQDLAGRLVVSEQACKMLKNENSDKLKERDSAIANLLQSVQANEGVISNLRGDIESFKKKLNESNEENRRLQHESEIFAAQIIDQDEEFESLNERLKEKTSEISSLKREIASSSSDMRNMKSLQSQLDQLRDDKRRNVSRINQLEVELRDAELKKAADDGYELERLKLELKNAIEDKAMTEDKLTKQIDSLRKLRNHAVEDFEKKLRDRDEQISSLEKELLELKERMSEDDFDDIFLDESKPGQSKKELAEERDMLLVKIETLDKEIESLKASTETQQLSELKSKLALSEKVREELEMDRSLFNSNKDREMDRLHKQLSEAREAQTARELEQLSRLKKLESENSEMREDFSIRIQEKNSKIVALEQTLSAQEQVVSNMSREMDQLQNGMEKISVQRRAEIEELQQELMDYTSKCTSLEREVMALSMKLDDKKLKHKTTVTKLKERIASLESETPAERNLRYDKKYSGDKNRESELEEKNDHLKWLNQSLKDANEKLKEKIEQLKASNAKRDESPPSSSKSAKNDKWRNVALQEQVAVLSQRVIELEEAASAAASLSRRPPQSPRPSSILHSPVVRDKDSNGTTRSYSAPKSALRTSTYSETDPNQANELLSNSDDEVINTRTTASTPPPLPRPTSVSTPKSEKLKGSKRFSLRKKSSKDRSFSSSPGKYDDASNGGSTANYDF